VVERRAERSISMGATSRSAPILAATGGDTPSVEAKRPWTGGEGQDLAVAGDIHLDRREHPGDHVREPADVAGAEVGACRLKMPPSMSRE
jgi:hypothetical protein